MCLYVYVCSCVYACVYVGICVCVVMSVYVRVYLCDNVHIIAAEEKTVVIITVAQKEMNLHQFSNKISAIKMCGHIMPIHFE